MLFICASMKPSTVCFYESVIKSNQDNMFCALPTSAFMHVLLCNQTFTHEKHEQGWAPPFLFMFSEVMTLASSNLLGDITTWCCLLSECTTRPNSLSFRFYSFLVVLVYSLGISIHIHLQVACECLSLQSCKRMCMCCICALNSLSGHQARCRWFKSYERTLETWFLNSSNCSSSSMAVSNDEMSDLISKLKFKYMQHCQRMLFILFIL